MPAGGPEHETIYRHLRPDGTTVFTEDFAVVVVIDPVGGPSIAGETFAVDFFDPNGAQVTGPTVSITDAALRTVTALFQGLTLVVGLHHWAIFRTDTGNRTETNRGVLYVADALGE